MAEMCQIIVNGPDGQRAKVNIPSNFTDDDIMGMDMSSLFQKVGDFMANIGKSVSSNGLNLIKMAESFSPKPYMDTNGKLSIGYGTQVDGVTEEDTVTQAQADGLLHSHLNTEVLPWMRKNIKVNLNQDQTDAVASLIYNIGTGRFAESRAFKALNAGDFDTFKREAFSKDRGFVKANGRTLAGLVGRRNNEERLFDGDTSVIG